MAVREEMTVHQALCELKVLENKIRGAIISGIYCVSNKHSNNKINGIPIEEYTKMMVGSYDKVCDFIARQEAIKRAVTKSNAVTVVMIGDKEYTVAEAIWMKNHGCESNKLFVKNLNEQFVAAQGNVNSHNGRELEDRADDYVTAMYGSKENRVNSEDVERTRNEFITSNSYEIIDPINISKKIEEIQNKIDRFMIEVDSALSVSNAITKIVVEY